MSDLIDEYIEKNKDKAMKRYGTENLTEIMKISEQSFMEWDNDEDEIYNDL